MKLSFIIPAFNEANRLPTYLRTIREYFSSSDLAYEIIVVDDGSTDGMRGVLESSFGDWAELRIVQHAQNQGRGQAIRTGCQSAVGDLVLYADADGATPIEEEQKLRLAIEQGADIAIGSRVVHLDGVSRLRTFHRKFIGNTFRMLVRLIVGVPVRDTQCGFKMWRSDVGQSILAECHDKQWLLDVEMLAIAHRRGVRIAEVPVSWDEVPGSKVHLIRDSWRMFCGLWRIRRSLNRVVREKRPGAIGVGMPSSGVL